MKRSHPSDKTQQQDQPPESDHDSDSEPKAPKSAKKRNNPLWDHFTIDPDWVPPKDAEKEKREQYAPGICKHCKKEITRVDGNTTNMRNHLKSHPTQFNAYQKALKEDKEAKVRLWSDVIFFEYFMDVHSSFLRI